MRVARTPHLTQRVNRFVQELFAACNEDGSNFILNDEEAYQCAKIIAVYNDLYCHNMETVTNNDLLMDIKRIKN